MRRLSDINRSIRRMKEQKIPVETLRSEYKEIFNKIIIGGQFARRGEIRSYKETVDFVKKLYGDKVVKMYGPQYAPPTREQYQKMLENLTNVIGDRLTVTGAKKVWTERFTRLYEKYYGENSLGGVSKKRILEMYREAKQMDFAWRHKYVYEDLDLNAIIGGEPNPGAEHKSPPAWVEFFDYLYRGEGHKPLHPKAKEEEIDWEL